MISIDIFKKSLGDSGQKLCDAEVKRLMSLQYQFANILFDIFALRGKEKIVTTAVIETNEKNGNYVCVIVQSAYSYA